MEAENYERLTLITSEGIESQIVNSELSDIAVEIFREFEDEGGVVPAFVVLKCKLDKEPVESLTEGMRN